MELKSNQRMGGAGRAGWLRLPPRTGWRAWVEDEALLLVWTGAAWEVVGEPSDISDAVFSLINDADPTKKAIFSLSGISTGTTRSYTLPNTSSELAILAGTQTFTGNKTFSGTLTASGTVTVSAATATIGPPPERDRVAAPVTEPAAALQVAQDALCSRQPRLAVAVAEGLDQERYLFRPAIAQRDRVGSAHQSLLHFSGRRQTGQSTDLPRMGILSCPPNSFATLPASKCRNIRWEYRAGMRSFGSISLNSEPLASPKKRTSTPADAEIRMNRVPQTTSRAVFFFRL
jgi:hypothetical protein